VTRLLLKDLRVGALFLWLIGLIYLLMVVQFVVFGLDAPLFLASVALAASLVASVLIVEWRVDADRFLCSLPVSRSTVVRGRCLSILAAGVSLVLWVSGGWSGRPRGSCRFNAAVGDLEGGSAWSSGLTTLHAVLLRFARKGEWSSPSDPRLR
jgi:hypothetical protein